MKGKRVLVVEDEFLLAMALEDLLIDEGCILIGPFARVPDAVIAARNEVIDLALLDINVAGEKVFPVAEILEGRNVPFILLTGYGENIVPDDKSHWQTHSKPYKPEVLVKIILEKISSTGMS